MATIVTRAGKGSPLTHNEVDANFENLNSDKVETSSVSAFGATLIDDADAATARSTLGLGSAATTDSTDYATAAQGALADSAVQPNDSPTFGSITVTGTVDGRDVATDGTKLDGIEAGADVTDTANVTAAGALMDSELTNITAVKSLDQGVATTNSPSFAGLTVDTDTLYVDSANDRVGIGTTSPAEALEVVGDVQIGSGSDFGIVHLGDTPDQTKIIGRGPSHGSLPNTFEVQSSGSSRLLIGSAGQLGIGGANYGTSGQVLTSNGSGSAPSWEAAGGGVDVQEFTASGTWTKPSSGTFALVEIWGGGGGGCSNTAGTGGAGGGGGGYNSEIVELSALTSTVAVTIGAGGTGGTSTVRNGGTGGTTTFGSYLTVYGGGGGTTGTNGGGGGGDISSGSSGSTTLPILGGKGSSPAHAGRCIENTGNLINGNDLLTVSGQDYMLVPRYGGGGGGYNGGTTTTYQAGNSVFGGGGGAGGLDGSAGQTNTKFGVSLYGGNGGFGATATGTAGDGVQPAGGGGGTENGNAGAGGAGMCRVSVW